MPDTNMNSATDTETALKSDIIRQMDTTETVDSCLDVVDLVSDSEMIVVSRVENFDTSLGKLLTAWAAQTQLKPRLHLFGEGSLHLYLQAAHACARNYTRLTTEPANVSYGASSTQ